MWPTHIKLKGLGTHRYFSLTNADIPEPIVPVRLFWLRYLDLIDSMREVHMATIHYKAGLELDTGLRNEV